MPSEWMPIESAPKDGSMVLVWDAWEQRGAGVAAFEGEWYWRGAALCDEYPGNGPITPTHWMPLPSPPNGAAIAPQTCVEGEPMMHGPQPYRWCATHIQLMLTCEQGVFPARAASEADESVVVNAASAIREYFGATADAGWTFEEMSVCNEDIKAMVRTAVRTALTTNQGDKK